MKASRYILSNQGIFAIAAILLTIAAALAIVGIGMEVQHPQDFATAIPFAARSNVTVYVMTGVMGKIPSVAGTLQSFALAIAYGLMPLVLISLFVTRAFSPSRTPEEFIAG